MQCTANSHQGSFLKNIGYDIASRLEIVTETIDENQNKVHALPHFAYWKDEIMRTITKIKTINPNNKIILKHQNSLTKKY
jgi:hypothetical protein